jgi:hypothetical protein
MVLILLSSGLSLLKGCAIERTIHGGMIDFKALYYDTRCLLQHSDPYKSGEPLRLYQAEGGRLWPEESGLQQNLMWYVYLPTTSIFIAPFAMLPYEIAHLLWRMLTAGSLILAAFLMWRLARKYSSGVSLFLICFILANCEVLIAVGNPIGVVVSLCVIAVWCFLENRLAWAGVLCLAASLAIKPHDVGFVWLYFLLAGGIYRKRALQTLLVTAVLGLAAILWVTPIAPDWVQELHSNHLVVSAPGEPSNPGPTNPAYGVFQAAPIDLQATISTFRDDPRIYNPVSYLVCGALLLAWFVHTLRVRFSPAHAWLALAAVVPLTMLVTYHRPYDAKLLLLAVPACAMLWAEGRQIRWLALLVTTAGIVLTSDIPLTFLSALTKASRISTAGLPAQMRPWVLMTPAPPILLAMGIFYLWIYLRYEPERAQP